MVPLVLVLEHSPTTKLVPLKLCRNRELGSQAELQLLGSMILVTSPQKVVWQRLPGAPEMAFGLDFHSPRRQEPG